MTFILRFVCADYSLQGALQNTERTDHFVIAYDVMCQYIVNLVERWKLQFPTKPLPSSIKEVMGKMHGKTHIPICQYLYSLYFTKGVGRTDGEQAERFWSEANQVAGSTKQMNPGHRNDTIDDVSNDWNNVKLLNHGACKTCGI